MEKLALNKILDHHKKQGQSDNTLPCQKLIGTFKDEENLYFLTELLKEKMEVW